MKIVFNDKFYDSEYIHDGASVPGRMEAIMDTIRSESDYQIVNNETACSEDISRVHDIGYIAEIQKSQPLYEMSLLSAGGAILASQIAMSSEAAFACIRPPGHHAYKAMGWGYCHFCNMAIAIRKLMEEDRISSAFILDFDAHTGDGTINCLSEFKEIKIMNPMAQSREDYINLLEDYIKNLEYVDIIAVSAGFDIYEKDVGKKLNSFDFYRIAYDLKLLAKKMGHNRRFAILEGGYYQPDLGKNVLSFCQGFE